MAVPRAHFAALDRALRSAELYGDVVAVNLGALGYPDLVAEIFVLEPNDILAEGSGTER